MGWSNNTDITIPKGCGLPRLPYIIGMICDLDKKPFATLYSNGGKEYHQSYFDLSPKERAELQDILKKAYDKYKKSL